MTERKTEIIFSVMVFVVCAVFGAAVFLGSLRWNESLFYDRVAAIASSLPENRQEIMKALKDTEDSDLEAGREILRQYGYHGQLPNEKLRLSLLAGGVLFGGGCMLIFLFLIRTQRRKLRERTGYLTEYLRQVEEGGYSMTLSQKQDLFSNLEDEIYKTVLALRESRESLKREKENLARDLADISHQFKTPLTSLSVLSELLLRRISEELRPAVCKIGKQTDRLTELCAALLTLSRADAGVLSFEIRQVPVNELIECSLEPVWPLLEEKGQKIVPLGEAEVWESLLIACDLGWTREAVGNLLKNAAEHGPEQSEIFVRVWDNPIYTGVAVEDEGPGFPAADLPHLFERFYRGANAGKDSAGIGLSLAKSLIESQNGEIRAENRKEGGADS